MDKFETRILDFNTMEEFVQLINLEYNSGFEYIETLQKTQPFIRKDYTYSYRCLFKII